MKQSRAMGGNKKMLMIDALIFIGGVFLDQWTKSFMTPLLKGKPAIPIIENVLEFHYTNNDGALGGMMSGWQLLFIVIAVIVLILFTGFLFKLPAEKKFNKIHIVLSMILAGAVGNTIDRVIKGSVDDFIYFKLIDFPIFNVADIYITIATFSLAFMILFCFKEEDFAFLEKKSNDQTQQEDNGNEAENK